MVRYFPCKNLAQAHMIRSYLLDHEIEAHVLHENAGSLWAGWIAGCVLSVHETDLEFLGEAFSAPREKLTDDSPFAESGCVESDSPPLRFGWEFFLCLALSGIIFVWSFGLLGLLFKLVDALPQAVQRYDSVLLDLHHIRFREIAELTCGGIGAGLSSAVLIILARTCQPREDGSFSAAWRLLVFFMVPLLCSAPLLTLLYFITRFS